MANGIVEVTEYTDPTCPFAFSASPELLALRWYYGDQLRWSRRLVVLSETAEENAAKGLTPEHVAAGDPPLQARYGMPLSGARPPRTLVSLPVDLAIKAVELTQPGSADAFMRALQVAWHSERRMIDEDDVIRDIADACGIELDAIAGQLSAESTRTALEADKLAARSPLPAATGPLDHKLAGPAGQRRYTCPSLEVRAVARPELVLSAPGMQNLPVYEALIANVEPKLIRREAPLTAREVLDWADWPLASAEVAAVLGESIEQAAQALATSGADESAGYWSVPSGATGSGNEDQLAAGAAPTDRFVSGAGVA